ncbi:hypothetical protein CBR_g78882 [Chara braunii]|uniref:Uncharacterized protein n=1 Tax=Chara braunii TaxID=69332 RepID=A0A388KAQ0_CHABU|nr:hypothetical protein CBR_g78882 [Chara braunii]|eukprot:GBG67101.1 hypothetical protein CBR_g78882 [Chara braunii]
MAISIGKGMEAGAAALGVSEVVFRFLICFLASLPCSAGLRHVPGVVLRHAYAAIIGVVLVHFSFGLEGSVYVMSPVLFTYAVMRLTWKNAGLVTFAGAFGFLIYCHVSFMSGDRWKDGGMDFTGALMVMTLKVTSCAMSYQDGMQDKSNLYDSHARTALVKIPSLLEFMSYTYCCGNVLVGPVYDMKDYLAYIERREIWMEEAGHRIPSPYVPAAKSFVRALFCLMVYVWLTPLAPWSRLFDQGLLHGPSLRKWGYFYLVVFTSRWKYYFIWALAETACCLSGFGFSGWKRAKDGTRKPVWTRGKNVDIIAIETGRGGAASLPKYWNITVSSWLREYVYLRIVRKGMRAGFWPLLITQILSGLWHGLYPGYLLFFANTALMIAGSRVIHRWERLVSPKHGAVQLVLAALQNMYSILTINYAAFGFLLLSLKDTLTIYGEMHYIGTLVPVLVILIGIVTPSPRVSSKEA